jgi:Ca2+-transporting ATPase
MAERTTDYYRLTVQQAFEGLRTSEKGLSREEAERRRAEHGLNELTTDVVVPKWLLFLSQFRDVLVVVLIVAAAISYAIGSYRDGTVMVVIVLVNAVIGFVQEYKVSRILESLKSLIQSPAKVMVDGDLAELPQTQLVPGDIIRLEAGDKVPADVRIIESFDLRTNDFSLTGESTPQGKGSNAVTEEAVLADRDNMAYMGTTVASGSATGVVVATGMETEMGMIAGLTQETTETRSPLEKELGALANWLTVGTIIIGIALFFIALWQGFSLFTSMIYALGIAVAMVPQALPAQVTVALSTTSKRLADLNAVVKNLPSVETLGSTSVIATDKTGTLTKNEMTVTDVWFNGRHHTMTGTGYEPKGQILDDAGDPLSQDAIDEIEVMMDAATMASNAEIHEPDEEHDGWYPVGDPTEAALVTMSTKLGTRSPTEDEENPELQEFPFDSERKRMSSVRQFGDRLELAMKGAPDGVLKISKSIYRDGKPTPLTEEDREAVRAVNEEYSRKALRVLAIAYRPLDEAGRDYTVEEVERDVTFLGLVGMMDPPREGVAEAIGECHEAQIRTFIMTGDHAITAQAVGREIGLGGDGEEPRVIAAGELKAMPDDELSRTMAEERSLIFSRVDPEDKLRIVELLEGQGEVVAVTGDGVNDAPALKRADIGVAMGRIGTDVAKEASELVLLDDSFPTLVHAVREGRTIYANLRKTVLASLTTNVAELAVVLFGLAAVSARNWAIPILAIQILAIDLLAEIMPLTFLTFDPPSRRTMTSPPRDIREHILNRGTSVEVALLGTLIGGLAFANFVLFMRRNGVTFTVDHDLPFLYARATAVTWLTIAFCQFSNILSRRYEYTTIFNGNFWSNRILLYSILASIGLTCLGIYGPYIHEFLSFARLSPVDWAHAVGAGLVFLAAFEILKVFKRARREAGQDEVRPADWGGRPAPADPGRRA